MENKKIYRRIGISTIALALICVISFSIITLLSIPKANSTGILNFDDGISISYSGLNKEDDENNLVITNKTENDATFEQVKLNSIDTNKETTLRLKLIYKISEDGQNYTTLPNYETSKYILKPLEISESFKLKNDGWIYLNSDSNDIGYLTEEVFLFKNNGNKLTFKESTEYIKISLQIDAIARTNDENPIWPMATTLYTISFSLQAGTNETGNDDAFADIAAEDNYVQLPFEIPTATNASLEFYFWSTSNSTSGVPNTRTYSPGEIYYGTSNVTLYACYREPTLDMFTFIENDDGITATAFTEATTNTTNMVLPKTYNDKPIISLKGVDLSSRLIYGSVQTLVLPYTLTEIGEGAFKDNAYLRYLHIPYTVTKIGQFAFYGCSRLTALFLPTNLEIIEDYAFANASNYSTSYRVLNLEISNNVTHIGNSAFAGWISTTANLNANLQSLGDYVFLGWTNLSSITIPNSVTEIGNGIFSGCTYLVNVTLSNNLTSLGDEVFSNCIRLASITLPDSINEIGNNLFKDCTSLSTVNLSNNIKVINQHTFSGCTSLNSIVLPSNLVVIGGWAFANCPLSSITIPTTVQYIENFAFLNCSNLTTVSFSHNINFVEYYAFFNCPYVYPFA